MNAAGRMIACVFALAATISSAATSAAGASPSRHDITFAGSPFGIAWGLYYGDAGVDRVVYMPLLRQIGSRFTKLYVFWDQVQPQPDRFDWQAMDAFVGQLQSSDEALVSIFSSSSWGTRRVVDRSRITDNDSATAHYLPPSPARDLREYRRFVFETVRRYRGKIRYWQNDAEPNNPLYWLGSKEEFVAQLKVFYEAVHAADPAALVVVGGYDGVFNPPEAGPPYPGQEVGLAFFDHVMKEGGNAFDVFDLRLYGNPYTIAGRVNHLRERMHALGYSKPFFCTEYDGPLYFEFAENLRQAPEILDLLLGEVDALIKGESEQRTPATQARVADVYARMSSLPPQTQMFLPGAAEALDQKLRRLQSRDLVIRNVLALAAGVQKTIYWQLTGDSEDAQMRQTVWGLIYGKVGLMDIDSRGVVRKRYAPADAFARMTAALDGVSAVARVALPENPSIQLFEVQRRGRGPVFVVWDRRDPFYGEDQAAIRVGWSWSARSAKAIDVLGSGVVTTVAEERISLPVSVTPIFVESAESK